MKKQQKLWKTLLKFTEIVVNLKISEYKGLSTPFDNNQDTISNIIEKYKNHTSITAIKNTFLGHSFVFKTVSGVEIFK